MVRHRSCLRDRLHPNYRKSHYRKIEWREKLPTCPGARNHELVLSQLLLRPCEAGNFDNSDDHLHDFDSESWRHGLQAHLDLLPLGYDPIHIRMFALLQKSFVGDLLHVPLWNGQPLLYPLRNFLHPLQQRALGYNHPDGRVRPTISCIKHGPVGKTSSTCSYGILLLL